MESGGRSLPAVAPTTVTSFDPLRARRIVARGLADLARPRTILHVDGHAFIQKVVRAKLAAFLAQGCVSLACRSSATDALSFLRDHRVDLILSSSLTECPGNTGPSEGIAFLRSCKCRFPDVPFLFYTTPGLDALDDTEADAIVPKSSNFGELLDVVRRFVPPAFGP